MLKLLRLGAEAGAAAFPSVSCLAAPSCRSWAPVWMVGASAQATTLFVGSQAHDRERQDPVFLATCMI